METPARLAELERKFEDNPRRYFAALANEYRKNGDVGRAIELCERHLAEQHNHLSGHVVLAQALLDAGRETAAWQPLQTALDLDPENFIALRLLAELSARAGEVEQARGYYFKALEIEPRNEQLLDALKALGARRADAAPAATNGEPDARDDAQHEHPTLAEAAEAAAEPVAEPPSSIAEPDTWRKDLVPTHDDRAADLPWLDTGESVEQDTPVAAGPVEEPASAPAVDGWTHDAPAGVPTESDTVDAIDDDHELRAEAGEPEREQRVDAAEPEPEAQPDRDSADRVESRPTLLSETMVDLYLQQGHVGVAIDALKELIASRPEDERLRARLAELEGSVAPAAAAGPTVRDLFARLGRAQTRREQAAAALSAAFAEQEDEQGPLSQLFGADGATAEPRDTVLAAALAAEPAEVPDDSAFASWLQGLRGR